MILGSAGRTKAPPERSGGAFPLVARSDGCTIRAMVIRSLALATAAIAVAACQPSGQPANPGDNPPADSGAAPVEGAIVSAAELVGEYRIPGVDGQDINLPNGISAIIDETTIRVSAGCVNFGWNYRFEGARLITETTPVISCRRGLLPEEEAVRAAFDAAETVRRLPSNGIEFSGAGRSVILFSQ